MIIAITQRDHKIDGKSHSFDSLDRSWYYFLKKHTLVPVPNMGHDFDYDNLKFDCLLITGGPNSVDRNLTENILFAYAVKQNKPVIGICHGAFAVNDLTNGINGKIYGHHDSTHQINMEGSTYIVNSHHSQFIKTLGKNMTTMAVDEDGNAEAIKHKDYPIYGVVWHPEWMDEPVLPKEVAQILL